MEHLIRRSGLGATGAVYGAGPREANGPRLRTEQVEHLGVRILDRNWKLASAAKAPIDERSWDGPAQRNTPRPPVWRMPMDLSDGRPVGAGSLLALATQR